jgi:RNA polymerase sigma-70 factor (ECF subfamily)
MANSADDNAASPSKGSEDAMAVRDLVTRLEALYHDDYLPLRRYVRRHVRDRDEEDDVIQQALAEAWEKRHQLRDRAHLLAWLLRICRTVVGRVHRHRVLLASEALLLTVPAPTSPTEQSSIRELILFDQRCLHVLSLAPQQKAVVLARLLRGLSVDETARQLKKSPGTVKATLSQAIKKLRAMDEAWLRANWSETDE